MLWLTLVHKVGGLYRLVVKQSLFVLVFEVSDSFVLGNCCV